MHAIFRKNYHFIKEEIRDSKELGHKVRVVLEEWKPNLQEKNYQFAPDWIKKTELYKLGVKDKMIVEVIPVEDDEEKDKQPGQQTQQPKPSGWGAGLPQQNS